MSIEGPAGGTAGEQLYGTTRSFRRWTSGARPVEPLRAGTTLLGAGDRQLGVIGAFLAEHAEVVVGDRSRVGDLAVLLGRALELMRGAPATS